MKPKPAEPEFIVIGKILAPWNLQGELKIAVTTDFPERFAPSAMVYLKRQPVIIENVLWHKGHAIIKLSTIDSVEDAEKLRGELLEVHHSQLYSLPIEQYYHFQLVGLEVRTTQGELLGKITEILSSPSNDNYVVNGANGEILIPAIEDVVKSIVLNEGYMIIEPIEGLLSLNRKAHK